MKKCFAYTRVSTAKQGEGVSLEAQREAIAFFAERNEIEIVKWFEEKETAAKKGRPIFGTMLKELRAGKAAGLVMHKIDRSARNFADWAKIGELADTGIDIHFATESLDFRSRGGRLTADIQAVIAADYVRNLREETIKGLRGRLKQGLYPFKAPIGYLDNGKGQLKTIDPQQGPLVRKLFELYASGGHSYRSLVVEAKHLGLKTSRGGMINLTGIERILTNPFYTGLIVIRRTGDSYPGKHESLISSALFKCVSDIRNGKYSPKKRVHNFTFRQLIRCRLCHYRLIGELQRGHVYYRCQTKGCPTTTLREETVTETLGQVLQAVKIDARIHQALRDGLTERLTESTKTDTLSILKMQLGKISDRLTRLTDAFVDDMLEKDVFNERRTALLLEKQETEQQLQDAEHQDPRQNHQLLLKFLEQVKSLSSLYLIATATQKRRLLEIITSNIEAEGRSLYLSLKKGIDSLRFPQSVPLCGHYRDKARSLQDVPDQHIVTAKCIETVVGKLADLGASGEISNLVADIESLGAL